eukprot:gb/GECG01015948.1/.p1 GENE.gb/GECG01015948.1/~~gb/GECG01015948.1/.p1  ORF type:complete len:683 (+),score=79.61 gb/GECG01015948.1/:1-2049(+)
MYSSLYHLNSNTDTDDSAEVPKRTRQESAGSEREPYGESAIANSCTEDDAVQPTADAKNENSEEEKIPYRRLWEYQKPEQMQVFCGIAAAGINGSIRPVFSILFTEILAIFFSADTDHLENEALDLMGFFFLLAAVAFLANLSQFYLFQYAGEKLTSRLRADVFKSLLSQEAGFFDTTDHAPGRLTARLASDASLVKNVIGDNLGINFQIYASLIAALVIALEASWLLTIIVIGIVPILLGTTKMQQRAASGLNKDAETQRDQATQVAQESLSTIRTVQSLGVQNEFFQRFMSNLEGPFRTGLKTAHVTGVGAGVSQFLTFGSYAAVFFIGGALIDAGYTNFRDMLRVVFALTMAASGAGRSAAMATDSSKAKTAVLNIFALIDLPSTINGMAAADELTEDDTGNLRGRIDFRDVHFAYPARKDYKALDGVNFTAHRGETVGIVGPSGSGKSTIMHMLLRYYDNDTGEILVDKTPLRQYNVCRARGSMGLVSQEPQLFADSVHYNIEYGCVRRKPEPGLGVPPDADPSTAPDPSFKEEPDVVAAARDANADGFIRSFTHQYATHVGDEGNQLSGGQRQRVAIARALIRDPSILLLDEATAALDTESERIVQSALDRVVKESKEGERQRTTIIVAHRLSTVKSADKIIVMNNGRVEEVGTHTELLGKGGLYHTLASAQGFTET